MRYLLYIMTGGDITKMEAVKSLSVAQARAWNLMRHFDMFTQKEYLDKQRKKKA